MARRPAAARTFEPLPDAIDLVINKTRRYGRRSGNAIGELRLSNVGRQQVLIYKSVERGGKWAYIKTLNATD